MKRLVLASLCTLMSMSAFSHSQSPLEWGGEADPLESVTMESVKVVTVELGNLNDYAQSYTLRVDEQVVTTIGPIQPGDRLNYDVPIRMYGKNVPERHTVCSVSEPVEGVAYRTRICSKADLIWLD